MRYVMQNTLDTKKFGDDIGKSLVKAKEVERLRSFNLKLTRIPKNQNIKIDSNTILQKIIFRTKAIPSTKITTSQKYEKQGPDNLLSKIFFFSTGN